MYYFEPQQEYEMLLAQVLQQGYSVIINTDTQKLHNENMPTQLPVALIEQNDKFHCFAITINETLSNADKDVYYATLGHELGHIFAKETLAESLFLNKCRRYGHPRAIRREIKADTYGCQVSYEGIRKSLIMAIDFFSTLKNNNIAIQELTQRLEAIDKR